MQQGQTLPRLASNPASIENRASLIGQLGNAERERARIVGDRRETLTPGAAKDIDPPRWQWRALVAPCPFYPEIGQIFGTNRRSAWGSVTFAIFYHDQRAEKRSGVNTGVNKSTPFADARLEKARNAGERTLMFPYEAHHHNQKNYA